MPIQKMQQRRDTTANWSSANPVLAAGEIGFDSSVNKFKIGNGTAAWNSLSYAGGTTNASDLTSGTLDIARIPLGTSASTVCVGNDSRLSDARTPTSHNHSASEINSGTLNDARLSSNVSLKQSTHEMQKRSFIDQRLNAVRPTGMWVKKLTANGSFYYYVVYTFANGKCILHSLRKNTNDDMYVHEYILSYDYSLTTTIEGKRNFVSRTGTWNDVYAPISYATTVGSTAVLEFVGTGLDVRHFADPGGGIWDIVIDGDKPFELDTYRNVASSVKTSTICRGLKYGLHRAVFTLSNRQNPAANGSKLGWLQNASSGDDAPVQEIGAEQLNVTGVQYNIKEPSNIEFAIGVRPEGSSNPSRFMPDHGHGTVFLPANKTYRALADRFPLDTYAATSSAYTRCFEEFSISALYAGIYPGENYANRLCNIWSEHRFSPEGYLTINSDFEFVRNTECIGYSIMSGPSFGNLLTTDYGSVACPPATDGTLIGNPFNRQMLFTKPTGTAAEKSLWYAHDWFDNLRDSTRPEDTTNRFAFNSVPSPQWFAAIGKVYVAVFGSQLTPDIVTAGTRIGWTQRVAAGFSEV